MDFAIKKEYYTPLKISTIPLDEHFENGIIEYNKNIAFKFD